MECEQCGQSSDWLGEQSDWEKASASGAVYQLYECAVCGNRQRGR